MRDVEYLSGGRSHWSSVAATIRLQLIQHEEARWRNRGKRQTLSSTRESFDFALMILEQCARWFRFGDGIVLLNSGPLRRLLCRPAWPSDDRLPSTCPFELTSSRDAFHAVSWKSPGSPLMTTFPVISPKLARENLNSQAIIPSPAS